MIPSADRLAGRPSAGREAGGWWGRMWLALAFARGEPHAAVLALAGFLARGGIVLLALPAIILPSVIGLAGVFGVSAFGIDGSPTAWFFRVVAVAAVAAGAWLVAAVTIGSVVDAILVPAMAGRADGLDSGTGRGLDVGLVMDLATVRFLCLAPLAAALLWASTRIYSVTYDELVTPSNLVTPLMARVVVHSADAVAIVAAAWLAGETVAALAVRRVILAGEGIGRSIVGAVEHLVRRPVTSGLTAIATCGGSALLTAGAMAAIAIAFDWCRVAARSPGAIAITVGLGPFATTRDFRPVLFGLAAVALAAAWLTGAALSGVASAWRSAAWTGEVVDSLVGGSTRPSGKADARIKDGKSAAGG